MPPLRYRLRPFQNLTSLPDYTPLHHHHKRHSHNPPLPPRIYPPLNIQMRLWDTFGIHPSLPKYRPTLLLNIYTRASQNLLLPPRIYPQPFSTMAYISSLRTQCVQCIRTVNLPIYVRTLALRWAWRTFYVPAGGGGCEPNTPPSLRPWCMW